ncbi:DUF2586 domain-containing protein [Dasania marina]|uniref:DUF2586 domain-containing protein n=1 Tax=Dasania marina TaxID=471499 RepID=UPI00035F2CA3|nr:DUF2586 domain-containing protein [Dasania marina]
MLGQVSVSNGNLNQGDAPGIEKKVLFIGVGDISLNSTISVNAQTDLDVVLGGNDSAIKTQVLAAQQNGGDLWQAWARPIDGADDWQDEADLAMQTISPEMIAVCTPITASTDLEAAHTYAEGLRTSLGRRVAVVMATAGIDFVNQAWPDYETTQAALTNGVAANRVAAVPLTHGNNLGVLMGRLCRADVSVSDSPMRTATGANIGLGATPVDKNDVPYSNATAATLDANRLTVVQTYPDLPGTYWGDCNLLEVPGGDYSVIEYLRPVDKACRAVRLIEIGMVANRAINSTPISQASTKNKLMKPLRSMAKSSVFNSDVLPGEIEPPSDNAVQLVWKSKTELETYISIKPYDAPKTITTVVYLDLSNPS